MTKLMKVSIRFIASALILIAIAFLVIELWRTYVLSPWTRDGRVSAEVVKIAPEVSGTVQSVAVRDNQFINKGEVLYQLDPVRFQLAVDAAEAEVNGRKAELALRQMTSKRQSAVGADIIAKETIDQSIGQIRIAEAAYSRALATLNVARLNLERATVKAPVDGYVTNMRLRPGDYAQDGVTNVTVLDANSFWITGYFEETKLANIKVGDPVAVRLMGFESPIKGHVASIAHGIADANDNPDHRGLPNVNPVFTWIRLAQRIPVRIEIEDVPDDIILAAGMTCSVAVGNEVPKGRMQRLLQSYL
ncbi:efflux RND transporter periplasmic adaptor subunit [Pseudomonas sp. CFSAN084952]|uniref:efflux RND transporter periplasmic adaptor subunit n=1 Tax=Pseudomonas TaxID=286 RepID=UPI001299E51A|nr:HlyD family secretion protein [Pseudomonas sp. CFSAN084952]QGF91725.1 efflux RND transporter periplasmic adaptor subunit [Pseudomonas sp. CFSAN084952]